MSFVQGQITVSVDGGEVVKGGAPLDLIVDKVQTIQSIFFRTAEFLKNMPLRRHGPASKAIQEQCRPWLFQSVPGSYQFSVAIQGPSQTELFETNQIEPKLVASTFMAILESTVKEPETKLQELVPDKEYRNVFLKLARNLAPNGESFSHLELRSNQTQAPVVLTRESRKELSGIIKNELHTTNFEEGSSVENFRGVLRAVHLEKDWIEVYVGEEVRRISGVGETVDDVIGPMVNHRVIVQVEKQRGGTFKFRDIELDDQKVET